LLEVSPSKRKVKISISNQSAQSSIIFCIVLVISLFLFHFYLKYLFFAYYFIYGILQRRPSHGICTSEFKHYLLGKHFKMFKDHYALKHLVIKLVLWGSIHRWLLLFQQFYFEVIVKPRKLNVGPDHLSKVTNGEQTNSLEDNFLDA
jgi:hypothetical protein